METGNPFLSYDSWQSKHITYTYAFFNVIQPYIPCVTLKTKSCSILETVKQEKWKVWTEASSDNIKCSILKQMTVNEWLSASIMAGSLMYLSVYKSMKDVFLEADWVIEWFLSERSQQDINAARG